MTTTVDVVCPAGVFQGDLITVEHAGQAFEVVVPAGVFEGDGFQVELEPTRPPADPNDIASVSDDDDDDGWYYGGPDPAASSAAQTVVQQAVQGSRLKPHEAAALRRILEAVNTFVALDDLVSKHAASFADYAPGGEQRLEWTTVHNQFVELVEARISFELDQLHATNQDLFALLSALTGQDEHADAFMARLLSLNDYAFFCEQMRLGGGVLRASVDDAV